VKKVLALAVLSGVLAGLGAACVHAPRRTVGHQVALSKCGACHQRPEPGLHDRGFLVAELEVHRQRAPLSDSERRALLEYLSSDRSEREQVSVSPSPAHAGARHAP